jgi:hypothetical protein
MVSYRDDLPGIETYDGASWVPAGRANQIAHKTANEAVASSTTLQDDNHLTVAVAANAIYLFELEATYQASSTGLLKTQLSVPASTTGNISICALGNGVTGSAKLAAVNSSAVFGGNGADCTARIYGTVTTAGTAGSILLQWAQSTSHATGTTLYAGSYMRVTRIG